MPNAFPLYLKNTLAANSLAEPDDVIITKRALERLGYYDRPQWGLQDFTDDGLFAGIRSFQEDNGLTIDGVMKPGGETERALIPQLGHEEETETGQLGSDQALNSSGKPSEERCEQLLEQETSICGQVARANGARAGAVCQQSAMSRYAGCLRGIPTHLLPPLMLPQYLRDKFDY